MSKLLPPLPRKPSKKRVKIVEPKPVQRLPPVNHELVELRRKAAEQTRLEMEAEKVRTDEEIRLAKIREEKALAAQADIPNTHNYMTIDEKMWAIEAYFEKNLSVKAIAVALKRTPSSISRFIAKQKSTTKLAKHHLEHNALRLARRVVKKADVNQALEVLHRVGAAPRAETGGVSAKFNIFVGGGSTGRPVVPSQLVIDTAAQAIREGDGPAE